MTALKHPFAGADLDGLGLGNAYRTFVLSNPEIVELTARMKSADSAHADRLRRFVLVILEELRDLFRDLFRRGEVVAIGHPVQYAADGSSSIGGVPAEILAAIWDQKAFDPCEPTGEIFERSGGRTVRRWTGVTIRHVRSEGAAAAEFGHTTQDDHIEASPVSDATLTRIAIDENVPLDTLTTFARKGRPWFTRASRDAAINFAEKHKKRKLDPEVHLAVTWGWEDGGIPKRLSLKLRCAMVNVGLAALEKDGCSKSTVKKYQTVRGRIRPTKTISG